MNGQESEAPRSPEVEGLSPRQQDDLSSFYETVLNLSNAMGRVEERSKAQEKQLTKVAENLEDVSKDVHSAKVGFRVVWIMLGLGLALLAWIVTNAVNVLRIFLSSP